MDTNTGISKFGFGLMYCAALVIVIAGLRSISSVVIPLLLATFLSVMCAPLMNALEKKTSFGVAFSIVFLGLIVVGVSIPILIGGSLQQFVRELPTYSNRLNALVNEAVVEVEQWELGVSREDLEQALNPKWLSSLLGQFLNGLIRTFGDALVVLIMVAFMLTEAAWFPLKLAAMSPASTRGSSQVDQIVVNIRRYIAIKTGVSLATGMLVGGVLNALGVKHAVLWGFLAFVMNFIPTIGSVLAGIPPVALALVDQGLATALGVAVLYLTVNQVIGNVIEPRLQGKGLGLSPLVVFVSLLVWGWVFGPVGMLLSAPLTMMLKIALEGFDETRWLALILGGKPATRPVTT